MSTEIAIEGEKFLINGAPTYEGRVFRDWPIEGLLMNNRVVQATFDDENPETRQRWAYPDTGVYDPERNVREFMEALPAYREAGLLAVTVNFQGGNPQGYCKGQPWENNAFDPDGTMRAPYVDRMGRVISRLDELGMVAILGIFYFGQDERLRDEAAVVNALDKAAGWVLDSGYRNALIEVNNECNVPGYQHEILQPHRVHELIERVKGMTRDGRRLLVGTSYGGGKVPEENVVRTSDFLLVHGNGVKDPNRIAEMVDQTRALPSYRPMPILFNEDDHYGFDEPMNNFVAAVSRFASWGLLDIGESNYEDGYQCPPVRWGISSDRKKAFCRLLKEISGG
jgi:hypothetical protein